MNCMAQKRKWKSLEIARLRSGLEERSHRRRIQEVGAVENFFLSDILMSHPANLTSLYFKSFLVPCAVIRQSFSNWKAVSGFRHSYFKEKMQTVPLQGSGQIGVLSQLISKKVNVSVCDGCAESAAQKWGTLFLCVTCTACISLPEQFTTFNIISTTSWNKVENHYDLLPISTARKMRNPNHAQSVVHKPADSTTHQVAPVKPGFSLK